jgi:site-specific DNA recombinase
MDEPIPAEAALRYVIYARKSTEDAEKQIRSIKDQVEDCKKLAADLELNVVDIIEETKSAKLPGKRLKFTQLMRDINAKKIDGIISWHPDRLARNAIEAGRIIHKIDTGVIKDLKFKTFQFTNDANGKMMLGMLFVFAKHYSDDLKTKIDRGMQNNLKEGKSSGSPKHGYIRDDSGLYRPDERNFDLIREAWQKRANGGTLDDIAEFLTNRGYAKYSKRRGDYVPQKMARSTVGDMFADTFYYGQLNQKDQTVDLGGIYDFKPMIDEATFYKVQGLAGSLTRRTGKKRAIYFPLRHRLFCDVCDDSRPMTVSRSAGRNTHYLYYTCPNKKCARPGSIRGKVVFDQITDIIDNHLTNIPDEAYQYYLDEVKSLSTGQKVKLRGELTTARTVLRGHKAKQNELLTALGRAKNTKVSDHINNQLTSLMLDMERQEVAIKKYTNDIAKSELPTLTPEEFSERVRKTADKFRKAKAVQKDIILQNLFLNLHIGDEKITSYLWKEPFATLLRVGDSKYGGAYRIRTDDLFHAMEAR